MNFHKLKYVVVAADSGSFREAARRLYMAQSSLSTAIKELEEEYQIQIFERTKRGIYITPEGSEFLSYARDILSQVDVLEKRYLEPSGKQIFSVSGQHYDFASEAFSQLIAEADTSQTDFRLLETSTKEVLHDVRSAYSELGILYMNSNNQKVIQQYLNRHELDFVELGEFSVHIFVGHKHPLADRDSVSLADLEPYPSLGFEQKESNTLQFSEEVIEGDNKDQQQIMVSDRGSSINVLVNTEAYLIGSGILSSPFKSMMRTIPVRDQEPNHIGYIHASYRKQSELAKRYIELLTAMVD
ncbi:MULTISPECIES: LysR family transcriptional regulator [Aerococcus]|uniref:LysR family transcriptional regulator n=2 Tax=Aerococcus TaxID=1375 RepID=A0A5N1GGK8_9LACT|nr:MULTISPECIES: LysR family transcriptional regulator [Aerococcus]KAA9299269.1 LysR family transcriptional regulator [Aerococcus sanguinicola]MDK6370107.1 LysR family transcriptional regulator [Aerococcus sp. UMB9870]MDK6680711.1 LysR family transcriptional regulator [Aerococcus sp. UMB8608]MDK6687505.1 LysR family transcriptional regulator [Aerococcus sp. UMB8623]MDK6940661.1 LysR family transcriptional regulator [Aerococcus sp. UMB8487]